MLLTLALLPLQWFALAGSPIGELRLHQLAMFGLTACIIAVYGFARIGESTRRLQYFLIANLYMAILAITMDLYNGVPPVQSIQHLLYLFSFFAIAGFFWIVANDTSGYFVRALRWASVTTVSMLLVAFAASLLKNGINPLQVIQQTIVTGDPSLLTQQLFGRAFVGFGLDLDSTQVQIRHEVFGALLLSMYIASWAKIRCPFTEPRQLVLYRISMFLGGLLVLFSLSRAVTLAGIVWPSILFARAVTSGRVSGKQLLAVFASIATLGIVAATGFLGVVWARFTEDTRGYVGRSENIADSIGRIFDNFWTGGYVTETNSSHNFVLDNWQRSGVLVALPALLIFLYIFWTWASLILQIPTMTLELLPVSAALTLPLFRMMTQGGGQISPNGWITMAFVTGVLHATQYQAKQKAKEEQAAAKAAIRRPRPVLVKAG